MISRRKFCSTLGTAIAFSFVPELIIAGRNDLPNVLILGDSISIGYTKLVREILEGQANVSRPMRENGKPLNCQGTTNGVKHIDDWLSVSKWDVIHFNFGLHDLKHVDPETGRNSNNPDHPQQAGIKQYEKNLKEIVKKLIASNAKLIFATTTPYPDKPIGPLRRSDQAEKYNKVALKIMKKNEIIVNDLYGYVLPKMEELQLPNNVHFTKSGSVYLAEKVAAEMTKLLLSDTN